MATDWSLRDFIFGCKNLDDDEKKLCYEALDREGFEGPTKREPFLALNDAELRDVGIKRMATRKALRMAMASVAGLGVGSVAGAGSLPADADAAAGLGTTSAGAAASQQGAWTTVGAGWLPAATGVAAGQSFGGTADAGYFADLFPSALYCMTFTLYDGVDVAMRLASHARATGFRGEVRHVSTSRSNFTLLLKADDVGKQTLKSFASWLATQVPVRAPGAEASTAFAESAEADAARVEVTSDPFNPLTRDRELLDMYNHGPLTVYGTAEVQLALEKANTAAEQRERLSKSSLGKSRASSSHAE